MRPDTTHEKRKQRFKEFLFLPQVGKRTICQSETIKRYRIREMALIVKIGKLFETSKSKYQSHENLGSTYTPRSTCELSSLFSNEVQSPSIWKTQTRFGPTEVRRLGRAPSSRSPQATTTLSRAGRSHPFPPRGKPEVHTSSPGIRA